jgi:hypothetical protein
LLLGEFLDKMAGFSEIMAGKPGKEVMSNLEVQPAMHKFHEWVTNYVGCGAELAMREGLCRTEIGSGTRVVGKDDLGKVVRRVKLFKSADSDTWTWSGLETMLLTRKYIRPVFQEPQPRTTFPYQ